MCAWVLGFWFRHDDGNERTYVLGLTFYDLEMPGQKVAGTTWGSGVAIALLGKRAGEVGVVEAAMGRYTLHVLSVQQDARQPPQPFRF